MGFTEVTGDLFDMGLPAIGHGVNCRGLMGAGIAKIFRDRFPAMYHAYKARCEAGLLTPGQIFAWQMYRSPGDTAPRMIYNLASQNEPGADATIEYVRMSLHAALTDCEVRGVPVLGLPRIGCGIGGLNWSEVSETMRNVAQSYTNVHVIAVTLPEPPARPDPAFDIVAQQHNAYLARRGVV
jgi:O-acetyl-ADP-ribose deacetylase (regulator of RNase III)